MHAGPHVAEHARTGSPPRRSSLSWARRVFKRRSREQMPRSQPASRGIKPTHRRRCMERHTATNLPFSGLFRVSVRARHVRSPDCHNQAAACSRQEVTGHPPAPWPPGWLGDQSSSRRLEASSPPGGPGPGGPPSPVRRKRLNILFVMLLGSWLACRCRCCSPGCPCQQDPVQWSATSFASSNLCPRSFHVSSFQRMNGGPASTPRSRGRPSGKSDHHSRGWFTGWWMGGLERGVALHSRVAATFLLFPLNL
jgi:hypothetical protein